MRRLLFSLTFITTLLPFAGKAQEAIPLSLKDAMDYAVKYNYTAKNARLDILLQQAKNAEITGLAYPQIKGEAKFTQFTDLPATFFPASFGQAFGGGSSTDTLGYVPFKFSPVYASSATVSGSQLLFDGSVFVALQARNAIVKLTEQSARLTEEDIRYNVQRAYYGFIIAQRQFRILEGSLANARALLNDLRLMREAGFAEKIDVDRSTVQVNNLVTDSIRVGNLLTVSEQLLKYRMGMNIDQPVVLTDTAIETNLPKVKAELLAEANYENRTDFNLLQTQLQLNEYDLKRHRMSAYPSLALFGSAGYNYAADRIRDFVEREHVFSSLWGLQLNVPITDGLQRRNRVVQARLNIDKTRNNIENMKLGIDFQVSQSRTTLRNALASLDNQRQNLELSNTVLDLARRKYKEGVGSNVEVTQAQTELLQSQNNYFQSMLEVINAQSDLQKALGEFKN